MAESKSVAGWAPLVIFVVFALPVWVLTEGWHFDVGPAICWTIAGWVIAIATIALIGVVIGRIEYLFETPARIAASRREEKQNFEREGEELLDSIKSSEPSDLHLEEEEESQPDDAVRQRLLTERDELQVGRRHMVVNDPLGAAKNHAHIDQRLAEIEQELRLHSPSQKTPSIGLARTPLAILDEAMIRQPDNPYLYVLRATYFIDAKDYPAAIKSCDKALSLFPPYPWALYTRGCAFFRLQDFQPAICDFQQAIQFSPRYVWPQSTLAELYNTRGNFDQALLCAQKVVEIDADHLPGYYQLGIAQQQLGKLEEALTTYTSILEKDPKWLASVRLKRAEILVQRGSNDLAVSDLVQKHIDFQRFSDDDYEMLIRLDPSLNKVRESNDAWLMRNMFSTAHNRRDYTRMVEWGHHIEHLKSFDLEIAANLTAVLMRSYYEIGRYEEAMSIGFSNLPLGEYSKYVVQTLDTFTRKACEEGMHAVARDYLNCAESIFSKIDEKAQKRLHATIRNAHIVSLDGEHRDLDIALTHAHEACRMDSIHEVPMFSSGFLWLVSELVEPGSGKKAIAEYLATDEQKEKAEADGRRFADLHNLRI